MLKIAIVTGSTRPGNHSRSVADWVLSFAKNRSDAEYSIVDIAEYGLPLLDEPFPPAMVNYTHTHTKKWSATIASYDGFIFITPEYNHAYPAALKNALDFLFREWNHKAAGFVSYGSAGGARAVEQLRAVMAELLIADVRAQVMLSLHTDFENFTTFKPLDNHEKALNTLFDQVVLWAKALKTVR
jgi:NAD(P)H-dependent FMN reductase